MEAESDDAEKSSEDGESADLNWLSSNYVDCGNGGPIARDQTCNREYKIPATGIVQSDVRRYERW